MLRLSAPMRFKPRPPPRTILFGAVAIVAASGIARADAPVNPGNWAMSAGVEVPVTSITVTVPGVSTGVPVSSVAPFVAPVAAVSGERRLGGDAWLLLIITDQFGQNTVNGLPQSTNGTTITAANTSVSNVLTAAAGIRHGVVHFGRATFSWFGMIGGGWSYESGYTNTTTVTTVPLTGQTTTNQKRTFSIYESETAATGSLGIVADVALLDNLFIRASTPLATLAWNTIATRTLLSDGSGLGPVNTSGQLNASISFSPALQLRLTF